MYCARLLALGHNPLIPTCGTAAAVAEEHTIKPEVIPTSAHFFTAANAKRRQRDR
jgi:hypothetical protein